MAAAPRGAASCSRDHGKRRQHLMALATRTWALLALTSAACLPPTADSKASTPPASAPMPGPLVQEGSPDEAGAPPPPRAPGGAAGTPGAPSGGADAPCTEQCGPTSVDSMLAGGGATGASEGAAGRPTPDPAPASAYDYAAAVENTGADCNVPPLPEAAALPAIPLLPDPFTQLDGTRLTQRSEWRCRRREIHEQATKYVYGDKPTAGVVTGSVSSDEITVHVEALGRAIDFSAEVVLPGTGQAPYPAIINVGARGGFGGVSLGESRLLEQGVAVIYYDHYDLGREGVPEQSRGLPNSGKFYDLYGGTHSAGLLMAWAWGASRLVDVLQQADGSLLDAESLGVTGCSRNGKGAFAIGVFDERIALTIPHETSTAGVVAYRLVDVLNTERTDHNYFGLNWFSDNFAPFVYSNGTSNVVRLPIDTHELVAMIAPRGLLVLDNPHQRQMSAPAGHLATAAGAEVYQALGVRDHVSYHSAVAETPHCSYKAEYTDLLERNIARFLRHEEVPTGDFVVGGGGDGNLPNWRQWSTPTLAE